MRIAGAARAVGDVSTDLIRKLEREGAIPRVLRDRAGHRRFTSADIERLRAAVFNRREQSGR